MATLNRCVDETAICIFRGDDASLIYDLLDSAGAAFDGTGRTYLLSVDTLANPPDNSTLLFSSTGVVVTTQVTFPFLTADVANIGRFFFDIQETDSGGLRLTIAKGTFEIRQDITKVGG